MKEIMMIVLVLLTSMIEARTIVLIDTSGSMQPVQEELMQSFKSLERKLHNPLVYAFNDNVIRIEDGKFEIGGGTNMSLALEKALDMQSSVVFLLSDGMPKDTERVFRISQEMRNKGIKLCSIYIGENEMVGGFMRQISNVVFVGVPDNDIFDPCIGAAKQHNWNVSFVEENLTRSLPDMMNDTNRSVEVKNDLPSM